MKVVISFSFIYVGARTHWVVLTEDNATDDDYYVIMMIVITVLLKVRWKEDEAGMGTRLQ